MNDINKAIRIIRVNELCQLTGISKATIYRWEANGELPISKIKLGPNSVGFLYSDVEAWLNGQVEN